MTSKLPSWLFLAFSFLLLFSSEASAVTAERTINSISQLRAANWGAVDVLHVLSYYDGQNQGGGDFRRTGGNCNVSFTGDISSGANTLKNLSAPVYFGEKVSGVNIPANTTLTGYSWNRVLSAATWTNGSATLSNIPDTGSIAVGMIANAVRIPNGAKVTAVTAPVTVVNTTGSINNGFDITITGSTAGIAPGQFVTATSNNDAIPKVLPDSIFSPGQINVVSIVGTTVHLTGSLGIAGVASSVSLRFTNGGSVTISAVTTGAEVIETPVLFYQSNATMSANATATAASSSIVGNGDDGGMHIADSANNCFVRQGTSPDILGWGAVPDNSTDSTGVLQNDIIYNSISTQPGVNGSVIWPGGVTGVVKASTLYVLKGIQFVGTGRESAILQQIDALPAQTPLVKFFSLYDQSNRYSATYLSMDESWQNLTLRGPNDSVTTGNETIGLYFDGYNSNPSPTDTDGSRAFILNLTVDDFKGFGIYNARFSGVVASMYKGQIRGITTNLNSNDCLHSDGSDTWGVYYLIISACDNGMYLSSPTSWNFSRAVAFSNNHGATITGSISSDLNNAQLNLGDFEFGFNKQNGLVIDSVGLRTTCLMCRVNDSGQVSTPGVFSDVEITANAQVAEGPVLILSNDYFTKVHSESSGQNHLNNITFDDGATANVAVDATTTTSSPAQILWTNLATCDGGTGAGTCTASLTYPPALVPPGTGLIARVVSPSAATLTLTAADCGSYFDMQLADTTFNLPVVPSGSCALTFSPRSRTITLNPNGNSIQNAYGSALTTNLVIAGTSGSNRSYFTLEWGSNGTWYIGPSSPGLVTNLFPPVGQVIEHGQVYFSYCLATCGPGGAFATEFQLCQYNGPGGIIINSQLRQIASTCAFVPSSATIASAMNYFYAVVGNQAVSAIADNGSGKAQFTVTSTTGLQSGDALTCYSITGTPLGNVTNDTSSVLVDATHFTLTDISFVATGVGFCQWIGMQATGTVHKTFNGIEVSNSSNAQTLVGAAFIGAANAVTDCSTPGASCNVVSYYNRQRKKLIVACGAGVTTGNGTSTTTYKTPATVCEGDFTSIGPPTIPGTYPTVQIHWMVNGAVANSFIAGTEGTSVCLGTSAKAGNATCTAETEEAFSTQDVATNFQSANVSGMTPNVSQGHNYIDLSGFCSGTTPTCTYSNGHTSIGLELWQ